jgi:hypothetical protein
MVKTSGAADRSICTRVSCPVAVQVGQWIRLWDVMCSVGRGLCYFRLSSTAKGISITARPHHVTARIIFLALLALLGDTVPQVHGCLVSCRDWASVLEVCTGFEFASLLGAAKVPPWLYRPGLILALGSTAHKDISNGTAM